MIVKRLEKDNKIKAMYSSSTVCATVYDTVTKDLIVIFNNGGQYKYPNVATTDYTRLEISESTGSDFNTYIKKKYTNHDKMDNITEAQLAAIKKEIDALKTEDDKVTGAAKTRIMMETMNKLIGGYINNGKVDHDVLRKVETAIAEYNKVANPAPSQPAVVA